MSKHPAQVAKSKKAAALKAAGDEQKRPQKVWLQGLSRQLPDLDDDDTSSPKRSAANQSQGPPRLLSKHEVCLIAGATYPSIWAWMRAGKFPRGRIVGGKSMWLSTEIEAWLAGLPIRKLKGDDAATSATM